MKENTRDKLIAISTQVMEVKGFNNTGIAEILAQADVPKGSFYHYFKSKDDLGLAIIDHYGIKLRSKIGDCMESTNGHALLRLRHYFDSLLEHFEKDFSLCNCLLGNLSQELSMQNPTMRLATFKHYREIENLISEILAQAKREGYLSKSADEDVLAKLFFASWEGCLVRAKLEQSVQPMRELILFYFDVIFQ